MYWKGLPCGCRYISKFCRVLTKPLFFTVREKKDPRLDPSAYLMRAGVQLLPSELNQLLNPNLSYAEEGKKVLEYGFQADENWIQQVQSWV